MLLMLNKCINDTQIGVTQVSHMLYTIISFWHIKMLMLVENVLWVCYFYKTLRIMKEFQSIEACGCATLTVTKNQFITMSG